MKLTLDPQAVPAPSVGWQSCVTSLDCAGLQRAVRLPAQEPAWQKEAARALLAAAHRAEKARAREKRRYGNCSSCLPPHAVLLDEAWAMEQLRALPTGRPQRASVMPRITLAGSNAPARLAEQGTSVRRTAGFAGKKRF